MADYIRIKVNGTTDESGFKLLATLTTNLGFSKGIDTSDLSLPTSSERALLPTSGLKEDEVFTFELVDDETNKAFTVNNVGDETSANVITTAEQLNFLLDNILAADLSVIYIVYSEWLNKSFEGILTIRGSATGDKFFNQVQFTATLKQGNNILS